MRPAHALDIDHDLAPPRAGDAHGALMTTTASISTSPMAMASGPGAGDRALAVRRPPASLSSRSTTTRRHRSSSRSHHGGPSPYLPQNEFPNFARTGDVEVVVAADGDERRYLLHRLILAQCSGFFEAGTSEEWSQAQAQAQARRPSQGGPAHEKELARIGEDDEGGGRPGAVSTPGPGQSLFWRYELDVGSREDEVPMLVQKPAQRSLFGGAHPPRPPPIRNKPPAPSNGFFRSISAMQSAIHIPSSSVQANAESDTIRDYDNLFRIFYNYAPALDAVDITEAYIQCKSLLALADMYDALEVVGPRIDHHLLQFQGRLWKQVAKYPPSYLKLGYLARSRVIFAEALVHVVGQWPLGSPQLRSLPDAVLELIEDKVDDLDDLRSEIEGRLFRLTLTTPRGERVTPGNAYHDWSAVALFRHWLAENTTPPPPPVPKSAASTRDSALPPPPPANGGRVYRVIGGASTYLGHEELKRFLKLRPDEYSREALRKLERRMDELKALAREAVRPLTRCMLELDLGRDGGGLGYLTCTRVEEADFPWD